MVFYNEWDIQVHVANHMIGKWALKLLKDKYPFFLFIITIVSKIKQN